MTLKLVDIVNLMSENKRVSKVLSIFAQHHLGIKNMLLSKITWQYVIIIIIIIIIIIKNNNNNNNNVFF